ncbi:MAG: DNA circularization N-terminal domain-containing protein [Pseudomonadota bacterium]
MSAWLDTIKRQSVDGRPLQGQFRSARFIVPGDRGQVGRRTQVHEYPLRDDPYVEDLGRAGRRFTLEVFVDGSLVESGDYTEARDALIAALEEPGPGLLQHPWYGAMQVSLVEMGDISQSTRDGGRATFSLTFLAGGDLQFPAAATYTSSATQEAADAARAAALADFADRWSLDGLPEFHVAELETRLLDNLAGIEAMVGSVAGPVADLIRAPADMGAEILGAISRVAIAAGAPLRALNLYAALFNTGEDNLSIPTTTADRRQQAASADALDRLMQRGAVIEAARQSTLAAYESRADALATEQLLADAIDTQLAAIDPFGQTIDDGVFEALEALRAAVTTDLRERGARLPELRSYTPQATLPALVIAHRLYGDCERADEIVARNKIAHPGFVPGGETLEVLSV